MTSAALYETRDGIAVITLNKPPVNGLGAQLRTDLAAGLEAAWADPAVKGIVLRGSERAFSGGADVTEFGTPRSMQQPNLLVLIRLIEDSAKPVVAAITGVCLGGGLELALSCHYRVASGAATLGLPEVKLGLLPGAGGTQRLPRLLGLERALNMIVSGKPAKAAELADTPVLDAVVEGDPLDEAMALARAKAAEGGPYPRVRDITIRAPEADGYLAFARRAVAAAAGPYPAPLACVEAVAGAVDKSFDAGLQAEREGFLALMNSPVSRAMRHVFAAERACAKIPDVPADTPERKIGRVAVIGAGTMGGGISMNFLNAGIPVVILETKQEALDRGLATIRRNYETTLKRGKLTQDQLDERMGLLRPTLDYADIADCDLVIEAVFEDMGVKQQVFEKLDATMKPGAILASNTSTLDVDRIAAFTKRPEDVIGLHFFSPANVMRLLEVVRGAKTAKDVLATSMSLARRIGKIAVVSGVCDGFIGNRMLHRYRAALDEALHAGASPQQIDKALESWGMKMGPYRMGDLAGLDIGWAVRKRRQAENPGLDLACAADRLCEAGRFGQKTGAGWYRYETGKRNAIPDPAADELIAAFRRDKGIEPRQFTADELVERAIFALVNEGARILEEGIALRASDIDIVYLNGYGFPGHRGGPMKFADEIGLPNVVRSLRRFAGQSTNPAVKAVFEPAPLLVRLAEEGKSFN
ncbi:MAG: 3-hydroxyacyl-CoA dehydrogenase NAD-binding domain-containing protein [Burkholderiaceae bacterium]